MARARVHVLDLSRCLRDLENEAGGKEGLRARMSAQEGLGTRTESCHLQGPSDGNCTVERRDAGVCVPTAYIYVFAQPDI